MTKSLEQSLQEIGFSHNLAKVYVALLEMGRVRASALIVRLGMHRHLIYRALEELAARKLVTKTMQRGVALFEAADPRGLSDEVEIQKQRVDRVVETLLEQKKASPLEVVTYEGLEGITRALGRNLLAPAGTIVSIMGASNLMNQPELAKYWKTYHTTRVRQGIHMRGLFDRTTDPSILANRNEMPLTEVHYLPQNEEMPAWFNICQDTLIMVVPSGAHPQAITIQNPAIVISLQAYFNYLWGQVTGD